MRVVVALLLVLGVGTSGYAELDEAAWKQATSGLRTLMTKPGKGSTKRGRIERIGSDNSVRAAKILLDWAKASDRLKRGRLVKAALATQKKLEEYRRRLDKKHKGDERGRSDKERARLAKLESAAQGAQASWAVEADVDRDVATAITRMTDAAAWGWILTEGIALLQGAKYDGSVYRSIFQGLSDRATPAALEAVLHLVRGPTPAGTQVRAIDWVAAAKPAGTYGAVLKALSEKSVVVRRAAVRGLRTLDDPRAVEHLVVALRTATGLLAVEIDQALFWFTGLSLEADAKAWTRWWEEHGAEFQATKRHERRERRGRAEDTSFYGITSPSKRIVFILDHSGSMQKPARGLDALTGKPRPGGSRMKSALEELRRAIGALAADVRFNMVFYNSSVSVWRKPRTLAPATAGNKADALLWLNRIEAEGTTSLFEALHQALEYTDDFKGDARYADPGVDTVYLLTDGAPTDVDGEQLSRNQVDSEMLRFLAANEVHRVVVHTIGIGRGHSRMLMERLAQKTGGKYARVVPD